jgi:hypothetical protein
LHNGDARPLDIEGPQPSTSDVDAGSSYNKQRLHKVAEKTISSMPTRWHG